MKVSCLSANLALLVILLILGAPSLLVGISLGITLSALVRYIRSFTYYVA